MRTLFWKIFAWFGVAQLLIVVAFYMLAWATQRGNDERFLSMAGSGLEARSYAAAVIYEKSGPQALREAWRVSGRRFDFRDRRRGGFDAAARGRLNGNANASTNSQNPAQNVPQSNASAPDNLAQPQEGADAPPPPPPPPADGPPPGSDGNGNPPDGQRDPNFRGEGPGRFGAPGGPNNPGNRRSASFFGWKNKKPVLLAGSSVIPEVQQAVRLAFATGSSTYTSPDDDDYSFIARRVQTTSGERYVGLQQIPLRGRFWGPFDQFHQFDRFSLVQFFGLTALMIIALCFGLARYLSAPATKLRMATHQFAEGDLSTRVGPLMGRRRDELADLGRDFDAMAVRIEELVVGQNRLLADISHELRTPLARLNVAVELALDSAEGQTCHFLDRIKEESAELDALIGQLLTLQRLESRAATMLKAPLDLSGLVESIAEDIDFEARSRGTRVEVMHLDQCEIVGNPDLLKSAVQNITRNAVIHGASERVEVVLEKEAHKAVISVRDFGPGVPEETLDKLFDPFYRVATDRARQSGGTGLGMSITKRAVEAHGGTVKAQNAVNGGLLVQISLPLETTENSLPEGSSHPALLSSTP